MKYVSTVDEKQKKNGCVFCQMVEDGPERDRENLLLYRGETTFTVMNLYPYNTGHLMVLPYAHVPKLTGVSHPVQVEMMMMADYFTRLLTAIYQPDGFNIGINMGRAAGAGIDCHLHMHVVPRWSGDSNFMAVVGETRVLPEEVGDTYRRIKDRLRANPPPKVGEG